jgi:bifunctional non-homologous end joining protein LigD
VKSGSATPARLLDFAEPMKAKLVDSMPSGGGWIYEIKFDGYRALALRAGSETRVLSRNQKISAANSLRCRIQSPRSISRT